MSDLVINHIVGFSHDVTQIVKSMKLNPLFLCLISNSNFYLSTHKNLLYVYAFIVAAHVVIMYCII